MKETRRPKGDDGGPYVAAGDDLYPEDVCNGAPGEQVSMGVLSAEDDSTSRLVGRAEKLVAKYDACNSVRTAEHNNLMLTSPFWLKMKNA